MLKTKTITTDKATLLVVECPKTYSLFHDDDWELIGRLPEITEEQWKQVVEEWRMPFPDGRCDVFYKDYVEDVFTEDLPSESGLSLLQVNEICFENPLGDKYIPENCPLPEYRQEWTMNQYDTECIKARDKHYLEWQEAQSKVWDKERCYIFIKVD